MTGVWQLTSFLPAYRFWDEASPGYEAAVTMRAWNLLTSFLRDAKAGGTRGTEVRPVAILCG